MSQSWEFRLRARSSADTRALFALIAAGGEWSRWLRPLVTSSAWQRQGTPAPGGVGAIRRLGTWPLFVRERVLTYTLDHGQSYTLVGPSPVRDYRAQVALTPRADGGTDLVWSGTFTERVPLTGLAIRYVLLRTVRFIAARLIRAAESGDTP